MYQTRESPELQSLIRYAELMRKKALSRWETATGEDMVRCQAEYRTWGKVVEAIMKAPVVAEVKPADKDV